VVKDQERNVRRCTNNHRRILHRCQRQLVGGAGGVWGRPLFTGEGVELGDRIQLQSLSAQEGKERKNNFRFENEKRG
jgi:hypothetical protein